MANITIVADGQEQKFNLEAETVTLGRGLESDIRLKDIKASRRHCQIIKTPQGFQCLDLSSGNGTFINGVQIKQQKLNPGDKIQIGSTTITFQDANNVGHAKPATQKLPAATAAAGKPGGKGATAVLPKTAAASPRPSTGSVPTATAPTKKITAKIDIAKAQTQPVPPAKKGGTGPVPRATTTSLKKPTQRAGSTRSMASATQRFKAEGRKKKTSPVAILIGLIGVAFVVTVGFIFFGGGEDVDLLKTQIRSLTEAGRKLEAEGKFQAAIAKFDEALKISEGAADKHIKGQAIHIRGAIKELNDQLQRHAEAEKAFRDWKAKFEGNKVPARQLWDDGKKLEQAYGGAEVPWLKEFKELLEKVDNLLRTEAAINRKMDFQTYRNELIKLHKLDNENIRAGNAQWGAALKDWKEYVEKSTIEDSKRKAENEIRTLGLKANEEVGLLRRRAQRKAGEEGKKEEAVKDLEEQLARFKNIEAEGEIKKIIEDLRK